MASEPPVDFDLVEYMVIAMPDLAGVRDVAEALRQLVSTDEIRILDLVGVVMNQDGRFVAIEPEVVAGMAVLQEVDGEVGGLLSDDDIAMAALDLAPDTAAVILVVEDCWAERLAGAARLSGGHIVGGERIPRHRAEATMNAARRAADPEE